MSVKHSHRWSKFWWQDWANDPALRACSLTAQGLWMRLLCIMHEAEPRGHLLINGRVPSPKQLVAIVGAASLKELAGLLAELKAAGVYSHDLSGVVFSRRMVRDTAATENGKRTGSLGGNPMFGRRTNGPHPSDGVNQEGYPPPLTPKAPIIGNSIPEERPWNALDPLTGGVNPKPPKRVNGGGYPEEAESESEVGGIRERESVKPREARRSLAPIPPEWEPNSLSKGKAANLGLNPGEVAFLADQMRAWAKAGDVRKADWHAMFDRFVMQEFSNRNAERRRAKAPSATAEIRAAVGTFLTVDLDDEEELPTSSQEVLQ